MTWYDLTYYAQSSKPSYLEPSTVCNGISGILTSIGGHCFLSMLLRKHPSKNLYHQKKSMMNGQKLKKSWYLVHFSGLESVLDWKLLKERPNSRRKDFATPNQTYTATNFLDYSQGDKWPFIQVTTLGKREYPDISGTVRYKIQADTDAKRPKVSSVSLVRGHMREWDDKWNLGPGLARSAYTGSTMTSNSRSLSLWTHNWNTHTQLLAKCHRAPLVYSVRANGRL